MLIGVLAPSGKINNNFTDRLTEFSIPWTEKSVNEWEKF
jgi:hypothetical protein